MQTRREFLTTSAAAGFTFTAMNRGIAANKPPLRIAAVNTVYSKLSHAYHIVGRLIHGYTIGGKLHQPNVKVSRMYNAQYHADGSWKDISRPLAAKKSIPLVESIAECLGGKSSLDVDGVLLIAEHGNYPRNELGQLQYPRYEFFEQILDVFEASKRVVPVFVDKHLSYDHIKARKMYDRAQKLEVPMMAGSSLPVTFRRPEWEPEFGAKIEEAVVVFAADLDIYGIHAFEVAQSLLERRANAETGIASVRTLTGDAVWKAWDAREWSPDLVEAALRRAPSRDYGNPRDQVPKPAAICITYRDGTRATLLSLAGYINDLAAAVRIKNEPKPFATWFMLPAPPGARFFDPLTFYIEEFIQARKAPYPVERTLLGSVMLDFAMRSAANGGELIKNDAMHISYQPINRSYFFKGSASDD